MQKVFKLNKNDKIEFTKKELDDLLDEVYKQGYEDGKNSHHTWTSPYWWYYPYYTTSTTTNGNQDYITITNNPYTITYDGAALNKTTTAYVNNNTK